jgi:putative oxidoreductase
MKKLFSTNFTSGSVNFSLFLLRVVFGGLIFFQHGYEKLIKFSTARNGFPDPFKIGASLSFSLVAFAEGICSILIVLGLLTRLAAIPLVISMGVVVFIIKEHASIGEKELPVMYLCAFLVILFTGPGKASVDKLIGK